MIWGTYFVTIIIKKFYLSNIWFEQRWKEGTEYQQGILAGYYKGIFFENVLLYEICRTIQYKQIFPDILNAEKIHRHFQWRKYAFNTTCIYIYLIYDTLFVIHHILYAVYTVYCIWYTVYLCEIMSKKLK